MTVGTDKHELQAKEFLEPGETILAMAVCQRPPTIERQPDGSHKVVAISQMGEGARVIVTGRRFVALKMGWKGRSKEILFDLTLRSVEKVETQKRHLVGLFGMPVLIVRIFLVDGRMFALGVLGRGMKQLRNFAEILSATVESLDGDDNCSPPAIEHSD